MTAAEFDAWFELMKIKRGARYSMAQAAEDLGASENSIAKWRSSGVPRNIALACNALLHDLEPFPAHSGDD